MKWVVCFLLSLTIINSAVSEDIFVQSLETAVHFMKSCEGDLALCFKEKALNIIDKLRQTKKISIIEGIELVGDKSKDGRIHQSLPEDTEARETEVESRLVDGVTELMESHRIQLNLGGNKEESRALNEARKKKQQGMGMMLPLIMMIALKKKMFLLFALLAAKTAIAFKAAVLIAAFLIFHDWGHQKATYEVVTHPHHSHKEHHHIEHQHIHAHDDFGDLGGHGAPSSHHGAQIALGDDHGIGGGHIGLTSDHGHGGYSVVDDDAHGQAYGGYAAHGGYHRRRK